jgi:hypothetical protein
MKAALWLTPTLLCSGALAADEVSSFRAYVDSDLCARLMLGPITASRIECSQSTFKEQSPPVLIRLQNNMVFSVDKEKMIGPLVGQLAEVSGVLKPKDGTLKLKDARAVTAEAIPAGDPARKLLDARTYKTDRSAGFTRKSGTNWP